MFASIRLQNFFSFKDTTIHLNPGLNVLIGVNGSGKSNIFKAIRLLYEGVAKRNLKNLIYNQWGGIDEILFANGNSTQTILTFELNCNSINQLNLFTFRQNVFYEITLNKKSNSDFSVEEKMYVKNESKKSTLYFSSSFLWTWTFK